MELARSDLYEQPSVALGRSLALTVPCETYWRVRSTPHQPYSHACTGGQYFLEVFDPLLYRCGGTSSTDYRGDFRVLYGDTKLDVGLWVRGLADKGEEELVVCLT